MASTGMNNRSCFPGSTSTDQEIFLSDSSQKGARSSRFRIFPGPDLGSGSFCSVIPLGVL